MEVGRRKIEAVFMADLDAQSEANRRLPTVRPGWPLSLFVLFTVFRFRSFSCRLRRLLISTSPLGFGDFTPQSQLVLFNVPLDYPLDDLKRRFTPDPPAYELRSIASAGHSFAHRK